MIARAVQGVALPGPPNAKRDLPAMAALLPEGREEQRAFNAGTMELGAIVCTARSPRCDECPLEAVCAWRLAGYPGARRARRRGGRRGSRAPTGSSAGRVMAELRASDVPVTEAELAQVLPDAGGAGADPRGPGADGLAARARGRLDPPPGVSGQSRGVYLREDARDQERDRAPRCGRAGTAGPVKSNGTIGFQSTATTSGRHEPRPTAAPARRTPP